MPHAGVCKRGYKESLFFLKDPLIPLAIYLSLVLISGFPYLPCFPPKNKRPEIDLLT